MAGTTGICRATTRATITAEAGISVARCGATDAMRVAISGRSGGRTVVTSDRTVVMYSASSNRSGAAIGSSSVSSARCRASRCRDRVAAVRSAACLAALNSRARSEAGACNVARLAVAGRAARLEQAAVREVRSEPAPPAAGAADVAVAAAPRVVPVLAVRRAEVAKVEVVPAAATAAIADRTGL